MSDEKKKSSTGGIGGVIIRIVVISIILAITSFLTPGFKISGLWSIIIAAVVISIIDYLVEKVMKVDASPFGKGVKGFVIAAVILYVTQFFVKGMNVSIIGAILASLVIGVLDAILPGRAM